MTVSSRFSTEIWLGNNVTTVFPYTMKVMSLADIGVYSESISTLVRTLLDPVLYVITGVGPSGGGGGTITLNTPLATGKRLLLIRFVHYTQDVEIENQGGFLPEVLEEGLDRLEMQIQQGQDQLDRAVLADEVGFDYNFKQHKGINAKEATDPQDVVNLTTARRLIADAGSLANISSVPVILDSLQQLYPNTAFRPPAPQLGVSIVPRYSPSSDFHPALYNIVGVAEPPGMLKFLDANGEWHKLSRKYCTLQDFGYKAGVDVALCMRRARDHMMQTTDCRTLKIEGMEDAGGGIMDSADPSAGNSCVSFDSINNFAILGDGRDVSRLRRINGPARGLLAINNCIGVRIEGITFDGNEQGRDVITPTGHHGLSIHNTWGLTTQNLRVINAIGYGMGLENADGSADYIKLWTIIDTEIINTGSDGIDCKSPTKNNDLITFFRYYCEGWSRDHGFTDNADNGLDCRFRGNLSDMWFKFTTGQGNAIALNLRADQTSADFSGSGMTIVKGLNLLGERLSAKSQVGVSIGGDRCQIIGLEARELSAHASSYAVSLAGKHNTLMGGNIDRCGGGVSLQGPSNIVSDYYATRCDNKGFTALDGCDRSTQLIRPRAKNCDYGIYATVANAGMTIVDPRSTANTSGNVVLNKYSSLVKTHGRVRTIPAGTVVAATTGYVDLGTGLHAGSTIDGVVLVAGDAVLVKNQDLAVSTLNVRLASTDPRTLATQMHADLTLDSVIMNRDDLVLVKDQITKSENGVYLIPATGAPTRYTGADEAAELAGLVLTVTTGDQFASSKFVCDTYNITVGTTALTFTEAAGLNGIYTVAATGHPTRHTSWDKWSEIDGATVKVLGGTVNANTYWTAIGLDVIVGVDPFGWQSGGGAIYQAKLDDHVLLVDPTGGNITVQPFDAVTGGQSHELIVKNITAGANTVTYDPPGAQLIEGAATLVLNSLQVARVVSDGVEFRRL